MTILERRVRHDGKLKAQAGSGQSAFRPLYLYGRSVYHNAASIHRLRYTIRPSSGLLVILCTPTWVTADYWKRYSDPLPLGIAVRALLTEYKYKVARHRCFNSQPEFVVFAHLVPLLLG